MLFVTLMKAKPGADFRTRVARRLEWKYPEGMRVLAEYWVASDDPEVIVISESDDPVLIYSTLRQWADHFDARVFPVITAEEGIAEARRQLAAAKA
jgi:hypothetical protein